MHYWLPISLFPILFASCALFQSDPGLPQFSDGTPCGECKYIHRDTLENGHVQETAVQWKKYNGEQREFDNGKLVRLAHFVDNHKAGKEYTYENGVVKDSVTADYLKGSALSMAMIQPKLPDLVVKRFSAALQASLANDSSETFTETRDGRITKAGEKRNEVNYIFFDIEYGKDAPDKNYRVQTGKNYFVVNDGIIVEEKGYEGDLLVKDFKKADHYKSYYANGTPKEDHEGDVIINVDKAACSGKCHVTSFNEKGQKYIEYWQEISDSAGVTQDKVMSKSYRNGTSLEFELHTVNGETISYKFFDDNGNLSTEYNKSEFYFIYNDKGNMMHEFHGTSRSEGKKIYYIDGTQTIYLPNGLPFSIFKWENGRGKQIK